MGRLLTLLGVFLMIAAIGGMTFSFLAPLGNLANLNPIPSSAGPALCREGETYEEDNRPSTTTSGRPTTSVRMFCVDSEGTRREVTTEFTDSIFGPNSAFGQIFSNFGSIPLFTMLILFSVGLMVFGSMVSRRRQEIATLDWSGGVKRYPLQTVVTVNGKPQTDIPAEFQDLVRQATHMAQGMSVTAGENDLTSKLRQLDEARDAGLISQTEYDRMRQQILDSLT